MKRQLRITVTNRANGRCEYCRTPLWYATQSFEIEHIMPLAKNGETALSNLALSCAGCNGHKHTRTEWLDPITNKPASLFHPRKQAWNEHFAWNDNYTLMVGLPPVGRATIIALQTNPEGLVNLWHALLIMQEHPPEDNILGDT